MKFPKQLYNGYINIKDSRLVRDHDYTPKSLLEFQTMLNDSQPTAFDMERYLTVKDFYTSNKRGYARFIRGTTLECTVLWTESKSIINWFGLGGIVYLNYNSDTAKYAVELHRHLASLAAPVDAHPEPVTVGSLSALADGKSTYAAKCRTLISHDVDDIVTIANPSLFSPK